MRWCAGRGRRVPWRSDAGTARDGGEKLSIEVFEESKSGRRERRIKVSGEVREEVGFLVVFLDNEE
jgi:hypothetical protein